MLEKAIELESGNAACCTGWMYGRGLLSEDPSYLKAIEYYERVAPINNADGYPRAVLYLANGYAGVTDVERSEVYYEKTTGLGSCFALVELGSLYESGDVVERSYGKAFELFQKAAEEKYPHAMYRVGLYLDRGIIDKPQPVEAFARYKKATGKGDEGTIFALGRCYRDRIGTEENPDRALEWFTKEAENNEPRCLMELGLAYEYGSGVEGNSRQAVEYVTKAAEQGYGYAQFETGDYYFFGYGACPEDNKQAVGWYEKTAANDIPLAMPRVGEYCLYDYDELNELEKTLNHFKKAAGAECYNGGLGICYEMGAGVEDNEAEAFKYYTLVMDSGNVMNMYRTELCYYSGVGVRRNYTEAYRWLNDAAGNESVASYYYLGKVLVYGEGCVSDTGTGVQWLMKTTEYNSDKA